jgi:hypothetical protein
MEFLVDSLKRNPKAAYSDLKAKADDKKLKVFPIMFGRAQLLLGIVKGSKRGTGKFAKASAAKRAGAAPASSSSGPRGRRVDPSSKSGQVRALLASGMSAGEIAKKVGCTVGLVYNVKSTMGKAGGAPKRGPGRPRKAATSSASGLDGIAGIVEAVRTAERERSHLRGVLEKLQAVIADALS